MKETTVKPIYLGFRRAGSAICSNSTKYTPLMGVLKGLTIGQDDPDSSSVDAEFFDVPFDIFYQGQPITFNFELANYELEGQDIILDNLFGGDWDDREQEYDGSPYAFSSEWEWRIEFSRGHTGIIIYRGLTIGTIKKDEDGALNFNVTITSLDAKGTRNTNEVMQPMIYTVTTNMMYSIIGGYKDEDFGFDPTALQIGDEFYAFIKHRFVGFDDNLDLENPIIKIKKIDQDAFDICPIILAEGAVNIGQGRTSPSVWLTINTHFNNAVDWGIPFPIDGSSGIPDDICVFIRTERYPECDFLYRDDIVIEDPADIPELYDGNLIWL